MTRDHEKASVEPMAMGDKLVFAAAFAAAFIEYSKDHPAIEGPDAIDEANLGRWQREAAFAAAKRAFGVTVGLKLAEISAAEQVEAADVGSAEANGAALVAHVIEAYRAGFDAEGVDCPYACDGMCGESPECMTCEYGEDDEEVVDPADLSLAEQAVLADAERALGGHLRMVRTDGDPGHACACETCDKECEHRVKMTQTIAMLNKVRDGQHDA